MHKKTILFAPNLSKGGGRTIVSSIIDNIPIKLKKTFLFFLDLRLSNEFVKRGFLLRFIKPTIFARLIAEIKLYQASKSNIALVLMLGSLGPLIRLNCKTVLYLHNKYLITNESLSNFNYKTKTRIFFERLWFKYSSKNVDIFVVQTASMRNALLNTSISKSKKIIIVPFLEKIKVVRASKKNHNNFVYIASGEPHKNHLNLINAWKLLALDNIFPELILTLESKSNDMIIRHLDVINKRYNTKITNTGVIDKSEVLKLYSSSCALIYPSKFESFGLPLLEAAQFNLPILASELDFVRDVSDPVETFNPDSPLSIARAVKRFLNISRPIKKPLSVSVFLKKIKEFE
jgi:glycosyltransferase involved in cell wall biosynthesis